VADAGVRRLVDATRPRRLRAISSSKVGDWILQYQQDTTGAFINDHQPDTPGYTTARTWKASPSARLAALLNDEPRGAAIATRSNEDSRSSIG
jgi:hypothetical protein